MKYTIEFTEVIAYLSQDIEADSKEEALEEAFELMENNVIPIANSNMDYCISTERKEEPELPDGLQKYIDRVGLNILYSNYHKSTNGIWSRAEVIDEWEDAFKVYEVSIDFGCQDDTRNESYRDIIYAYKLDDDEWTFGYENPLECEHRHSEHIPQEDDTNVREDVICLDCGMSVINQIGEE